MKADNSFSEPGLPTPRAYNMHGYPALKVSGVHRSYTSKRTVVPLYPPVSGGEKVQRDVLVDESPETGPPQPPESPSPSLRVTPHGKQGAH